ncbi:type ISP restriction/modification enzyme [Adhaeribacter rhizoryzae]|uniref:type ISP restriction/modification enzyme n=1 Tax=Adhaeribacter rhizoryzae TaxID=2607907 RepID=UPI001CC1F9BB|nr:type ISP restriction/modification enzyme [Adhaeribacter rhizoryzae]
MTGYKVVWTVLNALRAHDDRFNATVNKIELNKHRPEQIIVGRPEYAFHSDGTPMVAEDQAPYGNNQNLANQLALQFEQLQNVVFARMVQKVGDRRYWEQWAKNVAEIAERQAERINKLINEDKTHKEAFTDFLNGLKKNINPSITQHEAVEMLSQHIITKPVFEALFEGYSFVSNNPISVSMQTMLNLLEGGALEKDTETLQKFYESVKMRASNIDNAEGKQRIIIELYDKFFKTAFPKMVERLGIVYTPVEVVDFIIHSVNDVLKKEFGRNISDENVHVLDPFTGTGTFITRLLQSGLIDKMDLERKFKLELHANEIVLLAYYIAAVNIENAYHDQLEANQEYQSFEGIVLTDTFQLDEVKTTQYGTEASFSRNFERIMSQKDAPLQVIIGNPPYSVGQKSTNDNAQNLAYPKLDARIAATYAKGTDATNKNSLYDSYIKAFRWSTDRLDKNGGIVCFVSNGAWLDGNSADGFRKSLENEFSAIYVFNLRGNARTSGELRQKEAGNVFGGGSRTPISITLLVKNPANTGKKATIHYHDIGDYLNREEKLSLVKKLKSVGNAAMPWKELKSNEHGDWINERNEVFNTFISIQSEKKFDLKAKVFFVVNSRGNESSRDSWVYNSSLTLLQSNMMNMVNFYNQQVEDFIKARPLKPKANEFINVDPRNISWTSSLILHLEKGNKAIFENDRVTKGLYRPFFKQNLYLGDKMIHRRGQMNEFFPNPLNKNFVICISGLGDSKSFSIIITDIIPDVQLQFNGQVFPLYYYEERQKQSPGLFDSTGENEYIRRDGLSDFILERAKKQYGKNVSKEDIFYYVYGFLHSPTYRTQFANDLKKMLPRLPLVEDVRDFWKFSKAGRALAELHINYESVPAFDGVTITEAESDFFKVEKMRFPKKGQKDCIIYNSKICIENIPAKAYEYVINGKSAIEWVMERYQITTHKDSGIKNDPNDWAEEVGNPRYILDLILSVINVSVQTVDIVEGLPKVEF